MGCEGIQCFWLMMLFYISILWWFLEYRNLSKLKELFTYKIVHFTSIRLFLKKKIPLQLPSNCCGRTGPNGIITQVTFGPFSPLNFLFFPVFISVMFSSPAPWRMATPSVLQTFIRLHYKNTPGPTPELMSILDHLEEERLFFGSG